ncbi:MAG: hypothetical protein HFJ42_03610 [Clostridia bacterium]|nr:hypothetical protein [Clostridia bacterium]
MSQEGLSPTRKQDREEPQVTNNNNLATLRTIKNSETSKQNNPKTKQI